MTIIFFKENKQAHFFKEFFFFFDVKDFFQCIQESHEITKSFPYN